jgi:hypothetical protein
MGRLQSAGQINRPFTAHPISCRVTQRQRASEAAIPVLG